MTPLSRRLTLITTCSGASIVQQGPNPSASADAPAPSLGVVLLLDVLVRIEQRRQTRLRTLQTKAAS